MAAIVLHRIERTSPSLWTHMRLCGLRAALAATPNASEWVLHDPRLWLGSAFHTVMKTLRSENTKTPSEVWDAEIARAVQTVLEHPLDKRFSSPQRWPSYYLVRQRCISLASQIPIRKPQTTAAQPSSARTPDLRGAERRYEARKGRLVGKPDYYDGETITEYKSSLPDLRWEGAADVIDNFRRQLRIYAAIIAETNGRWPVAACVIAASGQRLEIPISQKECDREADDAVTALNLLNQQVLSGCTTEAIAKPSAGNCAACDYKIICPAFWGELRKGHLQDTKGAALEGALTTLQEGQDGDLYTAGIEVLASSRTINSGQQIVLRKSIHGTPLQRDIEQQIRVVDFSVRPDGRVRADLETIVIPTSSIPTISSHAEKS